MKRILAAAAMAGMLTGPAVSQDNPHKTPLQLKYEKEDQDRKDGEKAYDATMKRLKSQAPAAAQSDPWAGVRPAPEPKPRR
jgi:hypothetical protein